MQEEVLPIKEVDPARIDYIHAHLETPNWAPWLRFSASQLEAQARAFPDGQFEVAGEDGLPIAVLATNRIDWDGDKDHLPTWDDIAGESMTFEETYRPEGNTVALMSMSILPEQKGQHLPEKLVGQVQQYASSQGAEHIIGDFRPSGFAHYKKLTGQYDFASYVNLTRPEDGLPVDAWLRNVTRLGMQPLRIDLRAMVIPASLEEFEDYRQTYKTEDWTKVTEEEATQQLLSQHQPTQDIGQVDEVWECGETGTWYVNRDTGKAVYVESNFWGELPLVVA